MNTRTNLLPRRSKFQHSVSRQTHLRLLLHIPIPHEQAHKRVARPPDICGFQLLCFLHVHGQDPPHDRGHVAERPPINLGRVRPFPHVEILGDVGGRSDVTVGLRAVGAVEDLQMDLNGCVENGVLTLRRLGSYMPQKRSPMRIALRRILRSVAKLVDIAAGLQAVGAADILQMGQEARRIPL